MPYPISRCSSYCKGSFRVALDKSENIYIYIYFFFFLWCYEEHTISFQTFVWVFKIVVDSWKSSVLLLYIFWDDWSIFMISGSNQQLQQQLLFDHLAWIEHQFLSGIRDSRKAGSLWGMMRGVTGVRKSTDQSWLAKSLGLGLLCWGFKRVQEEIPSEEASTL